MLGGLAGLVGLSTAAGVLVTATVTPALAVSGAAATSAITMFDNMPSYLEIDSLMLPTEIYIKQIDGADIKIAEFYDQNRIPVTYDEVAPVMFDAMLSSEDKNYYNHGGVDLLGTVGAVVSNLQGNATRGGSTITQQYVKNVLQQQCEKRAENQEEVRACFDETTVSDGTDGIERMLQERSYAIALEQRYSKSDILLGYLNIAHFGGSVYGVGAAAQYYFDTDAASLTLGQAATLAGMVQEPNSFRIDRPQSESNGEANGYAATKSRQGYVLRRLLEDRKITQEEYAAADEAPLEPHIHARDQGCQTANGAAFFCDYVRTIIQTDPAFGETPEERSAALRRGGLKIYTTLDQGLQMAAEGAMQVVPSTMEGIDLGASGVQVEAGTGRILSMVQNRPYSQDPDVLAADPNYTAVNYNAGALNGGSIGHPAGSTYKLFSLVNWLEQGHSVNEMINGRIGTKRVLTGCDGSTQEVRAGNGGGTNEIGNFQNSGGYVGNPYRFTADSLNSGFLAMAERISVCSTNQLAMKMGVRLGNGGALDQNNHPYDVLGSQAVTPLDMAAAYATISSNGIYCQPRAIDRVVDANGNEIEPPTRTCDRVLSENVAATSAYALQAVMNGTGVNARTNDGVPIMGKTGIHQYEHTWMDGGSTKVATAVWVGNVNGFSKLNTLYANGWQLSQIRNALWPVMQRAANAQYGGDPFPQPDRELTRQVLTDLPNVVGMSVDDGRRALEAAGFSVIVGEPVDSTVAVGTIAEQNPGGGRAPGGITVTIAPSNGQGTEIPGGIVGLRESQARNALRGAGLNSISVTCEENGSARTDRVTRVDPAEGSPVNRGAQVTLTVERESC